MTKLKTLPRPAPAGGAMPWNMQALLQALPDAVLVMGRDGHILFANHSAEAFFALGHRTLAQAGIDNFFVTSSIGLEPLQKLRLEGTAFTVRDFTLGGKPVSSLTATAFGEGLFLLSIHYAGVPLKSEWAARVKQALKPAQHMARVLAHEIKNPLSGIRGAAQLLVASDLADDDRELAQLIETETQRILRLVEKVNIFDDAAPRNYTPVNLHEVLAQVENIALAGFASQISVVKKFDPSLPDIMGHADYLVQALLNLVKNAAEAVSPGTGQLTLRSRYDNDAGFHPETHLRLPVCIEIEDNGCGISPAMRERLFEPYQTTKPQGEGLGLSIVSKIIDDHGGAIEVSSVPGRTIFKVSFPMPKRSAP